MTEATEIQAAADAHYASRFSEIGRLVRIHDKCAEMGHQGWADNIFDAINEMPLCVTCVAIYPQSEECEWEILLGTGGPADRVLVRTGFDGQDSIDSATYQHQDWFTPWTDARNQDDEIVERFAHFFWFGDVRSVLESVTR